MAAIHLLRPRVPSIRIHCLDLKIVNDIMLSTMLLLRYNCRILVIIDSRMLFGFLFKFRIACCSSTHGLIIPISSKGLMYPPQLHKSISIIEYPYSSPSAKVQLTFIKWFNKLFSVSVLDQSWFFGFVPYLKGH